MYKSIVAFALVGEGKTNAACENPTTEIARAASVNNIFFMIKYVGS
jgi:hypothetical protein